MTDLKKAYDCMIESMGVPGLQIPLTAVKFFRGNDIIPETVLNCRPQGLTITSCQAARQAGLGDGVCLTRETIGCVAAAITFGLVGQDEDIPLEGSRVYIDIMKEHYENRKAFTPPSPKDFTDGIVYACKAAGREEFALFGKEDVGRYKDVETAKSAIRQMSAIQPPDTRAVFFFSYDFEEGNLIPDVVVLSVRPVELTRVIQAYQYNTGKRVNASMGGLRVVNSDLIVRPYLTQEINVSTYCLGARLIAEYEGDRMGIGMPYGVFLEVSKGMKDSRTGFPFHQYPGAC
ncbi:MAG: hypothetical protein C4522_00960 [Desulfobacteraceae bacterium]|nr:MAG: hypothetical protein C4522_00960 [Desulfobacteraceae bacterium]